jgi:hypothetical protein
VREPREKLRFKCAKCHYAAKRERGLKRHTDIHHKADSREKTDQGEMANRGKDTGNLHEFIGLVNLSRKPMVAGEKEKSAEVKAKSKITAGSRRKLSSADKHHKRKPKKMVSICTQTYGCCGQAGSTEVQTEEPDS